MEAKDETIAGQRTQLAVLQGNATNLEIQVQQKATQLTKTTEEKDMLLQQLDRAVKVEDLPERLDLWLTSDFLFRAFSKVFFSTT